jgi:hypothetical protein
VAKKPFSLGRTPGEGYLLAAEITKASQYFEREEGQLRVVLAEPPSAEAALVVEQQLVRLLAAKQRFDRRFLADPAGAVTELATIRAQQLDVVGAGDGEHAARDASLGRAVAHVAEWLWQQKAAPDKWHFRAMPVACLTTISAMITIAGKTRRKIVDVHDLKKLAEHASVKQALKGDGVNQYGGQKSAAIVLVALATEVGEQTVKRATNPPRIEAKKAAKRRAKAAKGSLSRRK